MPQKPTISILPAFGDNYIYLVEYTKQKCFVVDPGDARIVHKELNRLDLRLTHIFATHHHADHIGGIHPLKNETGCTVIGPDVNRISMIDTVMGDEDVFSLTGLTIRCLATPGHTATSVCYFLSGESFQQPVLFTGDTLFVCGCGRMFECDGQRMYASLKKLAALPDETLIYPGHDYTEENLRFALTIEPDNKELKAKLNDIQEQTARNTPTVPSLFGEEKKLNPFLKASSWQAFAALRRKKDVF